MKNKMKDISLLILVFISISCSVWFYMSSPHIGVVRSNYMIDNYEGMKETRKLLEEKNEKFQHATDSLKNLFLSELEAYNRDSSILTANDRNTRMANLQRLNIEFYKASETQRSNSEATQEDMVYGILNQMNDHIQNFGKEKGYDIILGTTSEGNILFGSEKYDITDDALEYLNSKHLDE